jgi:heat shock protein HslJ
MKKLILLSVLLSACVIAFECSSSDTGTSAKLEGTKWVLYALDGVKYTTPSGGKTVFIMLDPAETKMSGSATCNTIFGKYTAVKTADAGENVQLSLKFGPIASTEMFCNNVMDTETKFKAALEKTTQYKITKQKLYLYNDADKVILRFKAE